MGKKCETWKANQLPEVLLGRTEIENRVRFSTPRDSELHATYCVVRSLTSLRELLQPCLGEAGGENE